MLSVYEYRNNIKETLMDKMYSQQVKKWNGLLFLLAQENALAHSWPVDMSTVYSIRYKGTKYTPEIWDWTTWRESEYAFALSEDHPEWEEDLKLIISELEDIRIERYESERFLSGLVLFTATAETYERILGATLYAAIKEPLEAHQGRVYDEEEDFSINQYARNNMPILKAMNERLLMNLLTH